MFPHRGAVRLPRVRSTPELWRLRMWALDGIAVQRAQGICMMASKVVGKDGKTTHQKKPGKEKNQDREGRLALVMRENLKRRKAQTRARQEQAPLNERKS